MRSSEAVLLDIVEISFPAEKILWNLRLDRFPPSSQL